MAISYNCVASIIFNFLKNNINVWEKETLGRRLDVLAEINIDLLTWVIHTLALSVI